MNLSPRFAFWLFAILMAFQLTQAVWWVVFMNQLFNEQVEIAQQLGAERQAVEVIQEKAYERQVMVALEGSFFLLVFATGTWLMYRSLVRSEELKFHQQNFLMAVTHEFKTPIASLRIYLDTLRSPKISPEKKLEVMPHIGEDINRLEKLVENVLHAARFERHGYRLTTDRFDFSHLVKARMAAIERAQSQLPKKITSDVQDGIVIIGDAPALGRAIDAILENALCYHAGKEIQIAVKLLLSGRNAILTISDNGIGISKSELPRLFDRFYRAGNELTRRASGTGLGLYLCREIIRAHGGRVTAHSDGSNKGAEFAISLRTAEE